MTVINFRIRAKPEQQQYAVALYRVSTEDQYRKGLSVPEQRARVEHWATENNVIIVESLEIHHSAYRGFDEDPRVLELLEKAKNDPRISLFLVDDISRFARRRYLQIVWKEELRRAGVRVVAVSEPNYDPRSLHGIWLEGINEIRTEARSAEIAYHTHKGLSRNALMRDPETGWCFKNGSLAPDGYKNIRVVRGKNTRSLDIVKLLWEVDPDRAPIVRFIVLELWHKRGMSYRAIRDYLVSDMPKWDGRSEPVYNRFGKPWSTSTIREICIRALEGVYTGYYYWNRTCKEWRGTGQKWKDPEEWITVENAHPAIITYEEWEELKKDKLPELEKNRQFAHRHARAENSPYLFSGNNLAGEPLFVCKGCGGPIRGQQVNDKKYYLCANYKNKGIIACSSAVHLRKEVVEAEVLRALKKKYGPKMLKRMVKNINKALNEEFKDRQQAIEEITANTKRLQDEEAQILAVIKQGAAGGALQSLLEELDRLRKHKQELEAEKEALRKMPTHFDVDEASILAKVQHLEEMILSDNVSNKEKKEAIKAFVRQLIYDFETATLTVLFWPFVAANDGKTLKLLRKSKGEGGPSPMTSGGAHNRD
ncbi:MAG: recombinase family protein [Bacillota bacterium]|nr:recombinase family protein [Bacillota bacterium]